MAGDKFYTQTNLAKGQAPETFQGTVEDVVLTATLANKLGILEPKDNIKLLANSLVENRSDLGNNGRENPDFAYDKLTTLAEQGDKLAAANIDNYSVQSMLAGLATAKQRGKSTGRDLFEAWNGSGKVRDSVGIAADSHNHLAKVQDMMTALQAPENATLLAKFTSLSEPTNAAIQDFSERKSAAALAESVRERAKNDGWQITDNLQAHPDILDVDNMSAMYTKLHLSFADREKLSPGDGSIITTLSRISPADPARLKLAQQILGVGPTAELQARVKDPKGEVAVLSTWTPSLLDELATHVRNIKNSLLK